MTYPSVYSFWGGALYHCDSQPPRQLESYKKPAGSEAESYTAFGMLKSFNNNYERFSVFVSSGFLEQVR